MEEGNCQICCMEKQHRSFDLIQSKEFTIWSCEAVHEFSLVESKGFATNQRKYVLKTKSELRKYSIRLWTDVHWTATQKNMTCPVGVLLFKFARCERCF